MQAKLDDNQELNYLSEIRQCSILFINLVFDLKEQRRDYTSKLGKTLQARVRNLTPVFPIVKFDNFGPSRMYSSAPDWYHIRFSIFD